MRCRQLLESDVPAISRIHRRACLVAYAFMNWSYSEQECRLWYEGRFRCWDWGLVAEDEDTAGFIAVAGTHLDQLFVAPEHQKRGIGTQLLTKALARSPAVVTLNVFEENRGARAFYERHGFIEVQRFMNEQERSVELVYGRGGGLPSSNWGHDTKGI